MTCPSPRSWLTVLPPTRSRASRTITSLPSATSWRAAVRPARPAPTTTTSARCTSARRALQVGAQDRLRLLQQAWVAFWVLAERLLHQDVRHEKAGVAGGLEVADVGDPLGDDDPLECLAHQPGVRPVLLEQLLRVVHAEPQRAHPRSGPVHLGSGVDEQSDGVVPRLGAGQLDHAL